MIKGVRLIFNVEMRGFEIIEKSILNYFHGLMISLLSKNLQVF